MNKYIVYPDKEEALKRSAEIAAALGCGKNPEDVTRYWFMVVDHPTTKEGAMAIPDVASEDKLDASEKPKLLTEAQLKQAGWFEEKPIEVTPVTPELELPLMVTPEPTFRARAVERIQTIDWRFVLTRAAVGSAIAAGAIGGAMALAEVFLK